MLTGLDFEKLGFWEDTTPEENITIYGMDFANTYIIFTDELGRTPSKKNDYLVVAAYDANEDCFLWGKELKNFAALEALCKEHQGEALLAALEAYELPRQ